MDDVDPIVRELQTRRLRGMTAERKLEIADELLALARELKSSSLRARYPGISDEEMHARVSELFSHVAG